VCCTLLLCSSGVGPLATKVRIKIGLESSRPLSSCPEVQLGVVLIPERANTTPATSLNPAAHPDRSCGFAACLRGRSWVISVMQCEGFGGNGPRAFHQAFKVGEVVSEEQAALKRLSPFWQPVDSGN